MGSMGLAQAMRQSYMNGLLGRRVERAPAALGETGNVSLFTITGKVIITFLSAYVVTVTTALAATIRLSIYNSVTAVATVLDNGTCATNAIAAGSWLQFPDDSAASPLTWVDAVVPVAGYVHGVLCGCGTGLVCEPGVVRLIIAANDSTTGTVKWVLYYIPVSRNGKVVTA